MISRHFVTTLHWSAFPCIAMAACSTACAADATRPNVILVMTDDQGYGDFGFMGNTVVQTPHLDAMATRSARMTQFYVSPVCTPTRACLMTGRYNYRTRAIDTYIGRAMMETEEVTIAELLRPAGYATGQFGKWHLGDNYPLRPSDQGFDEVLCHRGGGIGQPSDPIGGEGKYTDPILFHNNKQVPMQGYCTDIYFDAAFDFMRKSVQRDKNFFAYIATNAPHGPFHDVPEDLRRMYLDMDLRAGMAPGTSEQAYLKEKDKTSRIYAMETNIDQNVGRLFEKLKEFGVYENTLVLFLVDNGPNGNRFVGPLRGHKGQVVDGGIRSPLLAHWPAQLEAGHNSDRVAAHIDLLPTILDACGVARPDDLELDGRSILPLLAGRAIDWPDRTIFLQWHRGNEATPYKNFGARSQRWKLVHEQGKWPEGVAEPPGGLHFELYDAINDPGETKNLATAHPEVVKQMKQEYDDWFASVSSTRADNYAPPRIHIGTPHENPTVLTRQDWRHFGDARAWSRNSRGRWLVHVASPGAYSFHLAFEPAEVDETMTLRIGPLGDLRQVTRGVEAGQRWIELPNIEIPAGDATIEAELSHDDQKRGVHQLFVEKH